jgi:hypothetical protein
MPEAVIVATARSPIGRANKGSLTQLRPDDLTVQVVQAALDKVPGLDPHDVDDAVFYEGAIVAAGALAELGDLDIPLGRAVEAKPGEIQKLTPSCDFLFVPDIDKALDDEAAKKAFWKAFRALGEWYSDFPPY